MFQFLFVHIDSGPKPALVAKSRVHVVDLAKSCVIGFEGVCSVQCVVHLWGSLSCLVAELHPPAYLPMMTDSELRIRSSANKYRITFSDARIIVYGPHIEQTTQPMILYSEHFF